MIDKMIKKLKTILNITHKYNKKLLNKNTQMLNQKLIILQIFTMNYLMKSLLKDLKHQLK